MNRKSILVFTLMLSAGCSVVDKSLFLKAVNNNSGWEMEKNKNYCHKFPFKVPWDPWCSHQYYSCDSNNYLALYFSNLYYQNGGREFVSIGPPLLPIFPISLIDRFSQNSTFIVRILILTNNVYETDSLISHITFVFNDTLALLPYEIKKNIKEKNTYHCNGEFHSNKAQTNLFNSVSFKFNKSTFILKKLTINFDKEFNRQLNSDFKKISLVKRNRYSYSPLVFKIDRD